MATPVMPLPAIRFLRATIVLLAGLLAAGTHAQAEPDYGMQWRIAVNLAEWALDHARGSFGEADPRTHRSLDHLATLYLALGRYGEAEALYQEAFALRRENYGPKDPAILESLDHLGRFFFFRERYDEAELFLKEALELRRNTLGPSHPDTLKTMSQLGGLYRNQGRLDDAEKLLERALALYRETLGPAHADTLGTLSSLAALYRVQGRLNEAESLYEESLSLSRQSLGPSHEHTLSTMQSLGWLYQTQGRLGEAAVLYEEAVVVMREAFGPTFPFFFDYLIGLATVYTEQGRYAEAEQLHEEGLSGAMGTLGAAHPWTINMQLYSVWNLAAQERWSEAVQRLTDVEPQLLTWLGAELYSTEATAGRRELSASHAFFQHLALNLATIGDAGADARTLGATVVLRFKGIQAEEEAYLARIVRQADDPEATRLAGQIAELRAALGRAFHGGADGQQIAALQRQLEAAELALGRVSRAFAEQLQVRNANLDDLRAGLSDGVGLLEIRQYRKVDFSNRGPGELHYAGVLVIGTETLRVVDLGPADEVDELVGALAGASLRAEMTNAAREIHGRILGPFAGEVAALDRLYIAPDGPLTLIPFARLESDDGRLLVERLEVRMIQTGRDLLREASERPALGLLAVGGIDFESRLPERADSDQGDLAFSYFAPSAAAMRGLMAEAFQDQGFGTLPGSGEEVATIARLYQAAYPAEPVDLWQGAAATEQRLTAVSSPPRVLHLATHGFYRDRQGPLNRPMLLSGVALAGANAALSDDDHDGILYAIEAQSLNLEGTELAVLSACETARGVIDYSEGVYGLVRALRTAGARKVLVTLRPVDDFVTRDFMIAFYERWLLEPRGDPAAALRATQLDYINAQRPPEVWAPYVMIGE